MQLLDGKKTSQDIQIELAELVKQKVSGGGKSPHLAAVLVGENGASLTYVNAKVKACDQVGFKSSLVKLSEKISEVYLLAALLSATVKMLMVLLFNSLCLPILMKLKLL